MCIFAEVKNIGKHITLSELCYVVIQVNKVCNPVYIDNHIRHIAYEEIRGKFQGVYGFGIGHQVSYFHGHYDLIAWKGYSSKLKGGWLEWWQRDIKEYAENLIFQYEILI